MVPHQPDARPGPAEPLRLLRRRVHGEISDRLVATFLRDADGRRPVHGGQPILQGDPHWRDLLLFYEYFHGDNGAGIGASHQTGWTGVVALFPLLFHGAIGDWIRARGRAARDSRTTAQPAGAS